jgi:hypothetical protein
MCQSVSVPPHAEHQFTPSFLASEDIVMCFGMIMDDDQAIKWQDNERELANHHSVSMILAIVVFLD